MGFRFPLASVLRLRELAEEREERLLQSIHGEIARASESLDQKTAEIEAVCASRDSNTSEPLLAVELQSSYAKLDTLGDSRKQLMEHIGKLQELKDRQVVAYRTALQAREALGQIRSQRQSEHETRIARQEDRNVDDAFGAKYARRRKACD